MSFSRSSSLCLCPGVIAYMPQGASARAELCLPWCGIGSVPRSTDNSKGKNGPGRNGREGRNGEGPALELGKREETPVVRLGPKDEVLSCSSTRLSTCRQQTGSITQSDGKINVSRINGKSSYSRTRTYSYNGSTLSLSMSYLS